MTSPTPAPYSAYKPSGVPWLGKVPVHWESSDRLKNHTANVVDLISESRRDAIYIALEHVESWTGRYVAAGYDAEFDSQVKQFKSGDVLFGKLRPYLAKVTCPGRSGVCVGEFLVLRPRVSDLLSRYLELLLRSKPVIDAIDASTFGARMPRADWRFIGDMPIPLPPLPEQRAIVRYLDHVDRRIRRYVAAKRKLIVLLEEERQAVVNQAVTRGLDPNVRLKPSGVEWLGDVPEHWEVGSLKRFAARRLGSIKAGPFGSQLTAAEMTEGDFKVYTQRNVIDRDLEKGSNYISSAKFDFLRAFEVVSGDVLVTSRGTIGRTALVSDVCEPGVLHPCLLRVQPDLGCLIPEFLMTLIQDSQLLPQQLTFLSNTTTIDVIYSSTLSNTVIPLPSLPEQAAILEHVDRATADIDSASARARGQIELVNEYRTRLIADVVTGKLDVRDAAAQLPEEGEGELLDDNGVILDYTGGGAFDEHMPTEGETAIESEVTA